MVTTERVYSYSDQPAGFKIFVDRLWPRGLTKKAAGWNEWMKEIAPSPELRRWFGHRPDRWEEFKKRYWLELSFNQQETEKIINLEKEHGTVVLLYAAKDPDHNHAMVLKDYLLFYKEKNSHEEDRINRGTGPRSNG